MGKTPTTSRKGLREAAPYRRARDTGAPLAKIQLVPVPAVVPVQPLPATTPKPAAPPTPAATPAAPAARLRPSTPTPTPAPVRAPAPILSDLPPLDLPMPVAEVPAPITELAARPDLGDLLAAAHTSLGFARTALDTLPHPSALVVGDPSLPEPPPGRPPAGDARSLRADDQFALIYRHGTSVVSRRGKLGQRGSWRVVDYPSATLAAHAYALECSRLLGLGFRDAP